MATKPIPAGYHTVTPYLPVAGVAKLLEFVKKAFNAEESERLSTPDGRIYHAEVRIGDSIVMMGEPGKEAEQRPGVLYVYVDNADAVYKRALKLGATSVMEPTDMFYGDRNAAVKDTSGNMWWIATHFEDVPPEELRRRSEAQAKREE